MNEANDLRDYEQRLLDYIERGGKFPQMGNKLTERMIDPDAYGINDQPLPPTPTGAPKP